MATAAHILTDLAEAEAEVERLREELRKARLRAEGVKAELSNILGRCDAARGEIQRLQARQQELADQIGSGNLEVTRLHQDIAALKAQAEELLAEIGRVGPGAVERRLRRERARLLVRIEDKEAELAGRTPPISAAKQELTTLDAALAEANDRFRVVYRELDALQSQLPSPYLTTALAQHGLAVAHARLRLDGDGEAWRRGVQGAIGLMRELHADMRAGKYRLDKYSDLIGGRAAATVEALLGAIVINRTALAVELFRLATDPELFFHQIFNVMRTWLFGLYLQRQHRPLGELLRYYRFAEGMRGAYVEAMTALHDGHQARLTSALHQLVRHERQAARAAGAVPGAGLVCLPALAFTALAEARGLVVPELGPEAPRSLFAGPLRLEAAP